MKTRRQYWVEPSYQFSTILSFLQGVIVIVGSLAMISIVALLHLGQIPGITEAQRTMVSMGMREMVVLSFLIAIPAVLLFGFFGFMFSYYNVGPLSRIESWLRNFVMNKKTESISVREKDALHGFVNTIQKRKVS